MQYIRTQTICDIFFIIKQQQIYNIKIKGFKNISLVFIFKVTNLKHNILIQFYIMKQIF